MRLHANARLSVKGRELLIERSAGGVVADGGRHGGRSQRAHRPQVGASATGGGRRRACWIAPRRPGRSRRARARTAIEAIAALRRLRLTGAEIAELLGMALSTVSGILTRIGMGKLGRLGLEPAQRYERERPGELIHVDVKKLGRIQGGAGQSRSPAATHYNPRVARAAPRAAPSAGSTSTSASTTPPGWPTSKSSTTRRQRPRSRFLHRALAHYAAHGIPVERVLTDNGSAYRSTIHALACRALGLKHLRTRPYRPQTNGKAERFIRTMLAGWAYGAIYRSSHERTDALPGWLDHYNHRRPHGSLNHQPPISSPTATEREQPPRVLHLVSIYDHRSGQHPLEIPTTPAADRGDRSTASPPSRSWPASPPPCATSPTP